jgi:hypothetical protein
MEGAYKLVLAVAIAVLVAVAMVACGGSGDSTQSTAAPTTSGGKAHASGEGSAAFRTPGGDNSVQNFGEEADAAELEAAAATLVAYMRSRAEDDWAKECAYLAKTTVAPLQQLASSSPQLKGKGCGAVLAALSSGTPASVRVNTMAGGLASLRVEGDRGFALYHGTHGVDYFVPMVKEDGEWKVGALAPNEFP